MSQPTTELTRCTWCGTDELYVKYHDNEWGKEVHDDETLFEFLLLESAQAGLSWITILRRREGYRKAFADFDVHKVAAFDDNDVERLMNDTGIIRNRLKILAAINNAKLFIGIQKEFGSFYKYLYSFMPGGKPIINHPEKIVPSTPISDAISKDMKKRGFKFFGTTICYAHMQATGMVNDHITGCSFK
ncbi:DNA-3-methyladenine glycosylase I [uncultured Mucilaginibacter sp.]|uniref:DNA-3-methyladenine glycosylase I n=1 Tax=uncultured Mucilaginibacter sp. TaxID=797541 RepID=UPI0025D8CF61|nr:DNA-3-methyladenine glycosylase I [uncultured Mucilaginibacter sp.]